MRTTRARTVTGIASAFLGVAALMMLPACSSDSDDTFEEAGKEIDESIEEVKDEIDDATDGG